MQSSYFQNRIASKREADGDVKLGWGQTAQSDVSLGATALGDARKAKREARVADSDIVDKTLPSMTGTIVSVVKGNGNWNSFKVGLVVSSVKVPDGSVSTFALPSKAVYQIASKKLDKSMAAGEKIALPHAFPEECVAVRIDGIVVVDVKAAKNGPNEAELKESDILVGTTLTLKDVVFAYSYTPATDKYPARVAAYGGCKSVEYDETFCKGPSHPRERMAAVFNALSWKSNGAHSQMINAVCDHVGKRPAALLEDTNLDKESLAAQMERVVDTHADSLVGVGQPWESRLFAGGDSNTSINSWREVVASLRDTSKVSLNLLHAVHPSAMMRSHVFPVVQYPMDPNTAALTDRDTSGVSFNVGVGTDPEFCDLSDPLNPFVSNEVRSFAEATLSFAADKRRRLEPTSDVPDPIGLKEEDITSKTLGSIAFDVASFAFATRLADGSPFAPCMLKTADGVSVVIKQFLDSCKKGNIVNALGVYDYYRVWMLCNELAPYLPSVHFTCDWNNEKPVDEIAVQPKCENGWANDGLSNIYDVGTAAASAGVQVTKEFLEENAIDEERYLHTPTVAINYIAEDGKDKKPVPPRPPKLDVHGFACLNGLPETSINRVKKVPEASDGYKLFVVYEGCAADVKGCANINQDAAEGSAFLVSKFGDEIRGKLANTAAIYCVSNPPAATSAKKQRTGAA